MMICAAYLQSIQADTDRRLRNDRLGIAVRRVRGEQLDGGGA
jgi:hypothetical protein